MTHACNLGSPSQRAICKNCGCIIEYFSGNGWLHQLGATRKCRSQYAEPKSGTERECVSAMAMAMAGEHQQI
jgi:hypothetical protein